MLSHSSVHLAACLCLSGGVALIVKLFTSAESNLHLDVLARKVERQRNERKALLRNKSEKLIQLSAVQEQLAFAKRLSVEYISLFIRTYVHSEHVKLSVLE